MSEEKKNEVLNQAQAEEEQELSDAAGGNYCFCAMGGGGEAGWGEKTCVCVVGGGGEVNDTGRYFSKKTRCACVFGGAGDTFPS